MKTTLSLFVACLLLLPGGSGSGETVTSKNAAVQQSSASILCTPDLFDLTSKWASEYTSLYPANKIKVVNAAINTTGMGEGENLSFISNKASAALQDETNWKMVVGRDVIVPVMNAGNPFLNEIIKSGVSPEKFSQLIKNPEKQNWGTLLTAVPNAPVHLFMVNDASIKAAVSKFLQAAQLPLQGITLGNSDEVVAAVQKDPYAIGFCKVNTIMGPENQSLIENIRLLPIDKNGNGRIDYMEDIYSDLTLFLRGVWIGKYPKALYNNIYAVRKLPPSSESELAFLRWVLTDGQQFLNTNGYCDLVNNERQSQLDKISTANISMPPSNDASTKGLVVIILVASVAIMIIINAFVRRFRNQKATLAHAMTNHTPGFDEHSVAVPSGLYFDKTHTWAFMEKDGTVTIGLDDFMQHITGPITRIEMKNPGEKIKKGDPLFSIIQSGKQLNIYSPVSGTIKKQNEALITQASCLNASPYTEGWVYRVEPLNWLKEIQLLDMADKYKRWLETEFPRIKDFLAATLRPESLEYSHVVLQDGGMLKDGVLADFGPELWEDFQTNFLDNYR